MSPIQVYDISGPHASILGRLTQGIGDCSATALHTASLELSIVLIPGLLVIRAYEESYTTRVRVPLTTSSSNHAKFLVSRDVIPVIVARFMRERPYPLFFYDLPSRNSLSTCQRLFNL
jgi:hypothetical protein